MASSVRRQTTPASFKHECSTSSTTKADVKLMLRQASNEFATSIPVNDKISKEVAAEESKDVEKHITGPKDFKLLCVIGKGTFGTVIQVCHEPTNVVYAMKIVSKSLLAKQSKAFLRKERDIMTKMNHPFIIRLQYAFQTEANMYLVMPFVAGGELFNYLQKQCMIMEDAVRFYAAEMVLALEHLHAQGIIHRDLKPENILIGADGHLVLTDFGLAKEITENGDSTETMCGTDEYMAPEIIRRVAYNKAVDWWAMGALIYEMLTGKPPFKHKNKKKLHEKILNQKLLLPKLLDSRTHSILKQLLCRNVEKRLGSGKSTMFQIKGTQAIKNHPFFKEIDWAKLARKKIDPPLIPAVADALDTQHFDEQFTQMNLTDGPQNDIGGSSVENSEERLARKFSSFSYTAEDEEM